MEIVEADGWSSDGLKITDTSVVEKLKSELLRSPIIVEHWHYRGSRSPSRVVFEDYEDYAMYLDENAKPGDKFYIWSYETLCRKDNPLVSGKLPDSAGRVPKRGAY